MAPTTSDHDFIRSCIARYCIGVDLRDWTTFSSAFTDTAKVTFPGSGGTIEGIDALKMAVQGMVGNLQTLHALSTQIIEITGEGTAEATTYSRADIFGVGEDKGKLVTNWGIYRDKLVRGIFDGREDWRIAERNSVVAAPPHGDLSLLRM
ncbi:hypothetical protein D7B24_004550 [Verticillium nonalfalfae]|uniref:SnoaL-like domain-containing protein n=1 Tax=Verticillium nonalfalfae TaxID=1051616 RepID=A0A3M9XUS8_9PEZI|nr:uncharacterized protein D7B24_004550 [Verticillium nonalfalfae]RNJ52039.1 hypothetical protein D7B24_004550 [Verticillium nonalfalfae]